MNLIRTGFVFLFLLAVSVSASAEGDIIRMSQVQMYNLGIKLGNPEPVQQVPMLYAPAKDPKTAETPPIASITLATSNGYVSRIAALGNHGGAMPH